MNKIIWIETPELDELEKNILSLEAMVREAELNYAVAVNNIIQDKVALYYPQRETSKAAYATYITKCREINSAVRYATSVEFLPTEIRISYLTTPPITYTIDKD